MSPDEDTISFPEANISAVTAIAGAVATTFGPVSNDKFVGTQSSSRSSSVDDSAAYDQYVVTSDGAAILEALPLEHPIAPVVRRIAGPETPGESETDGEHIADGTTGTFILTAALLEEARTLLEQGLHPTEIRRGYDSALVVARESLAAARRSLDSFEDHRAAELAVAKTAMTGNDVGGRADRWAEFAVDAAETVGYPTPENFGIERLQYGSIDDSQLVRGAVLPRNEFLDQDGAARLEDATVLVLSGYKREDVGDGRVGGLRDPELQTDATIQLDPDVDPREFEEIHVDRRRRIVESLAEMDVDVVVTRLGINDAFRKLLREHGIVGVRGVNRIKLQRVARATGANPVRDAEDFSPEDLGRAGVVEQRLVEQRSGRRKRRRIVVFDDCPAPESVSVLLQGTWSQVGEEATRELRKAAAAVSIANGGTSRPAGVVPGGGAVDIGIARDVRRAASDDPSRSQLAMAAFADAVERLPFGLAKNGGLDPLDTVATLRAEQDSRYDTGVVFPGGTVDDVVDAGVLDPYAKGVDRYRTAVEVAALVLGIDDAIDAEFTQTPADEGDAIYDERAEKHADHLEAEGTEGTVWDQV